MFSALWRGAVALGAKWFAKQATKALEENDGFLGNLWKGAKQKFGWQEKPVVGPFSLKELLDAGQIMDRGGLTRVGRALEKHGGRANSVFPKAGGDTSNKNIQGRRHLEEILIDTNREIIKDVERSGFEVYARDGRGAYFKGDGTFRGFIERQYAKR